MPMAIPRPKLDRASLGTYVSFVVGVYGVVGELRKPVKDIPAMAFYIGLMGVPVVFPGTGPKPPPAEKEKGNGK